MSHEPVIHGVGRGPIALAGALLGLLLGVTVAIPAAASEERSLCADIFDPAASYPALSAAPSFDLSGEAAMVVYMQRARAVVEWGDCLYEVDRPLEFDPDDDFSLLFEFVEQQDQGWLFVSDADGSILEQVALDGPNLNYLVDPQQHLGFEWAPASVLAPTEPVIISKPKPKPKPKPQ